MSHLGPNPRALRAHGPSSTLKPSGRLQGWVQSVRSLDTDQREAMWQVFSKYYASITRQKFDADLQAKQDVILLADSGDHSLQGFSTIEVYAEHLAERAFVAVYSGDTVITEPYWGQSALHRTFTRYLLRTKLRHPLKPVYWYLISKGYKTYLLLARNVPNHYPRHDRATPPFEQQVLDTLSTNKFKDAYRPEQGILRFATCQGRLKPGVAPIETSLLEHADIRFFVQRNPGHSEGDELCCLGKVDAALPFVFTARQLIKPLRRGLHRARRLWAGATTSP